MPSFFVGIPNNGTVGADIVGACLQGSRHPVHVNTTSFGNLTHNFNDKWAAAYNHRKKLGLTHFVMLHDDLLVEEGWIDQLWEEYERFGADMLSVVNAIGNNCGLTSTGLILPGTWQVRRLTFKEIYELPETFTVKDTNEPTRWLGVNTGCWILRMDEKIWQTFPGFTTQNRMHFYPESDRLEAFSWSEDWEFSRWLQENGYTVAATRKVKTAHRKLIDFPNSCSWGDWQYDKAATASPATGKYMHLGGSTLPTPVTPHGDPDTWCPAVWDWLYSNEHVKTVLDVGCGAGFSCAWWEKHGCEVLGIEADHNAVASYQGRVLLPHDFTTGPAPLAQEFDLAWCCEVVEHVEAEYEANVLDALCKARTIALTHALPGQEGTHHVNCQDSEYWIERIQARGYQFDQATTDILRAETNHGSSNGAYFAATGMIFRRVEV